MRSRPGSATLTHLAVLMALLGASDRLIQSATSHDQFGRACHCVGVPVSAPCEQAWQADAVFVGEVVAIIGRNTSDENVPHRARMKVSEVFRGEVSSTADVESTVARCGFTFDAGQSYLVYARREPDGTFRPHTCSRTALVSHAAEDLAYLRGLAQAPAARGTIIGQALQADLRKDSFREWPYSGGRIAVTPIDPLNKTRYEALTGADGKFTVPVPTGQYDVTLTVREGLYALPIFLSPVEVVDVRGCGVTHFQILPDGRIGGRVLDTDGGPISDLSIEILRADALKETTLHLTSTRTDDAGRFEFSRVHPGTYVVGLLTYRGGSARESDPVWFPEPNRTGPRIIAVDSEERVWLGNLQLPNSVQFSLIEGSVSTADGRPATGATVRVMTAGSGSQEAGLIQADANGRFTFTVIAGRKYLVSAVIPQPDGRSRLVTSPEFTAEPGRMPPIVLRFGERR